MATEGVHLEVEDEAIHEMARAAFVANTKLMNIGARRLQTIVERIMETISFEAADMEVSETRSGIGWTRTRKRSRTREEF